MRTVFEPAPPPVLTVSGTRARFPVRRVYCVGRNYRAHAVEMGDDPDRNPPFFFDKPGDAVVDCAVERELPYPPQTSALEHEIELAVALGEGGFEIPVEHALDRVFGYAVALDLTRRDLQRVAKEKRRPWDLAKGFDGSAPVGAIRPVAEVGHPEAGAVVLQVNGEERQRSDLSLLIWPVAELIAILSRSVRLMPGDLILTGTPAGVGPLERGDVVLGTVEGIGELRVRIGA